MLADLSRAAYATALRYNCFQEKPDTPLAYQKQNSITWVLRPVPDSVPCFKFSLSYNLTPPISRVLIGQDLIFCSLTSLRRAKSLGFQLSHRQPLYIDKNQWLNPILCTLVLGPSAKGTPS